MIAPLVFFLAMPTSHAQPILREMVRRAQVPAHIKDVWLAQIQKTEIRDDDRDFKLPGQHWPLDWHLGPDRSVVAKVALDSGQITLFPPFYRLPQRDRRAMIIHLSLHSVAALAVVRTSETLMQELAQLIRRNLDADSAVEKERTRRLIRTWLSQAVGVDGAGNLALIEPKIALSQPWPWRHEDQGE